MSVKRKGWNKNAPFVPATGAKQPQPRVQPRRIECKECGAQPGAPCITSTGKQAQNHKTRVRLAVRAGHVSIPTPKKKEHQT